jgi:hypothetical protein
MSTQNSVIISSIAVGVSLAALLSSWFLTTRQQRQARQAVHIPTFLQLMSEFRDPQFHDRYKYVVFELGKHDPELRVFDLPEEARTAVIDITYFIQNSVCFAAYGLLDEAKVMAFLHVRIYSVWEAIRPYIEVERRRNSTVGKYWLSRLELYAQHAREIPQKEALRKGFLPVGAGRGVR